MKKYIFLHNTDFFLNELGRLPVFILGISIFGVLTIWNLGTKIMLMGQLLVPVNINLASYD